MVDALLHKNHLRNQQESEGEVTSSTHLRGSKFIGRSWLTAGKSTGLFREVKGKDAPHRPLA